MGLNYNITHLKVGTKLRCKISYTRFRFRIVKDEECEIVAINKHNEHITNDDYTIVVKNKSGEISHFYNFNWDGFTESVYSTFYTKSEERKLKLKQLKVIC